MLLRLSLLGLAAAARAETNATTVLVFGDSWGDTGPTWKTIRDAFARHGRAADVRSAAVGGTTACGWAPSSLVNASRQLFPELADGPDFVWYTAGGNDISASQAYRACSSDAADFAAARACLSAATAEATACSAALLGAFFDAFPASQAMQCGYDVQCADAAWAHCMDVLESRAPFCGANVTCANALLVAWQEDLVAPLEARFAPRYAGINVLGAVQVAGGVPGAAVGAPALDVGAPCEWETSCVHPTYGTPAEQAIGDAFWDLYFRDRVSVPPPGGAGGPPAPAPPASGAGASPLAGGVLASAGAPLVTV